MANVTPEYVMNLETRMQRVTASDYTRLSKNTWWQRLAKRRPGTTQKERLYWLLDTAKIRESDKAGGSVEYDELVTVQHEYEHKAQTAGLKIPQYKLTDIGENGLQLAVEWSSQIAAYAAYWPQKKVAEAILGNGVTYDGLSFFHNSHPYNPVDTSLGTFANQFTADAGSLGTAAGFLHMLYDVQAEVSGWKMPNGEDPRMLRVGSLFIPPALKEVALQATNARTISKASDSGPSDVEALVQNAGVGQPVVCEELGAAHGGSDSVVYIGLEDIISNELGAFIYSEIDPFNVVGFNPKTSLELARGNDLEWIGRGRSVVAVGHPYLLVKVTLQA
jgi:hypothetical protein